MASIDDRAGAGDLATRVRARLAGGAPVDVVCVGLTAWDIVWEVARLPAGGGKQRADAYRDGGGGMAANAAVAVARLGGRAHYWGRAGEDAAGRAMRAELAAAGVDVDAMRLFAGSRSSVSGILVDPAGERSIVNFRGEGLPDDPGWLPLARVAGAAAVLADPRWPAGARAVFEAARAAGVPTVLDGDVADAEVFDKLLPWVDYAIFSEPGLAGYAAASGVAADVAARLHHARTRGCRLAAVTLGADGLAWSDGGAPESLPAYPVDPVDTTGAGDVFHGAFALAIGARLALADCLRFAAAVAALKCLRPGGRAGIPDLAAVASFLTGFKEP